MATPVTHTPGPWLLETVKTSCGVCHKIGRFPSRGARSETYGCVYEDGTSTWHLLERGTLNTELLANARLMAAAPDLLAALKHAVEVIATHVTVDALGTSGDGNESWPLRDEYLHHMNDAIAKAEGR